MTLIINTAGTLLVLRIYLQRLNIKPLLKMARQFASNMGLKSQEVQHTTRNKKLAQAAKQKVANAAIEELPMGGILKRIIDRANISPDEIFALIQDQEFIKGIKVIIGAFGGVVEKITGKGSEEKKLDQNMAILQ